MQDQTPQRIVLRLHEKFGYDEGAILTTFFKAHHLQTAGDYFSHLHSSNESSKMYIILDLCCKTIPAVNLGTVDYKVFEVHYELDELNVILS